MHGSYAGAYIGGVTFSPNGNLLVVGCHVALLKIFRHEPIHIPLPYVFDREIHLGGGWSAVTLLTFEPKGRYLACTNNGSQIRIVDTLRNQVVAALKGHTGRIESLCFTSSGRTLASGSCDRTVRFWDVSKICSH